MSSSVTSGPSSRRSAESPPGLAGSKSRRGSGSLHGKDGVRRGFEALLTDLPSATWAVDAELPAVDVVVAIPRWSSSQAPRHATAVDGGRRTPRDQHGRATIPAAAGIPALPANIANLAAPRPTPYQRPVTLVPIGLISVYGGYFGAGSGVLLVAATLILLDPRLPEANAIKNMLVGTSAVAASAVFVVAGPVAWDAVAPLAVGAFAGSTVGPIVARRVPARVVRLTVAALGLLLAVQLWLHPGWRFG
jgi:hypothetical protein